VGEIRVRVSARLRAAVRTVCP